MITVSFIFTRISYEKKEGKEKTDTFTKSKIKKEVRQMMEHIIKSLATKDTATVILVLGLTREARLWHKQILEHKRKLQNKK